MKTVAAVLAASAVCWSAAIAQSTDASLQQLYDRHAWFELRDAIAGRTVAPLYAGAVASAFNRTSDAEKHLARAIREAATPEAANEARDVLANLYERVARTSDMLRVLDAMLAAAPSRSDVREGIAAFETFRNLRNQTARLGQRRPFACTVTDRGVHLPVVINGKPVTWLMDTAFSHPAMSESEARRVGIAVKSAAATGGDFAGGSAALRTAIADRMTIGGSELRHVPVLVFPDSQPPFSEEPAGKQGAIGLPVVLALGGVTWTRNGTCRVGADPARGAAASMNLSFDGGTPVVRAQLAGKPINMVLDTGNQAGTQFWTRFSAEFPNEFARGSKATQRVHQIGGSVDREIVAIPELRLTVGGFPATLRPANVFSKPIGNELHHGNLGMDVLSQAAEVTIDFHRMSLTLR